MVIQIFKFLLRECLPIIDLYGTFILKMSFFFVLYALQIAFGHQLNDKGNKISLKFFIFS